MLDSSLLDLLHVPVQKKQNTTLMFAQQVMLELPQAGMLRTVRTAVFSFGGHVQGECMLRHLNVRTRPDFVFP